MVHIRVHVSGGSKGGARDMCPPGSLNSFNFMQFLGNFGKIVCWCVVVHVGAVYRGVCRGRHWGLPFIGCP